MADPEPGLTDPRSPVLDGPGAGSSSVEPGALIASISALPESPEQNDQTGAECEIGAAIALVMARFPVTYTRAFAVMIAYSERTQQSLPDLAAAVLKTYSPRPGDTSPRGGTRRRSANRMRVPMAGERR